jgi:poly-gamma-glutamate synthesis protein (capsule biosynthesis protein)
MMGSAPVFHGLGNFASVTMALSEKQDNPERQAWARRRRLMFGFDPDPKFPMYPFHPDSRNTLIAVCDVDKNGPLRAGFLPCWINEDSQPEIHSRDETGARVAAYIERITREAGLKASFHWDGDQITFCRRN